jgi:hypothetical protein
MNCLDCHWNRRARWRAAAPLNFGVRSRIRGTEERRVSGLGARIGRLPVYRSLRRANSRGTHCCAGIVGGIAE